MLVKIYAVRNRSSSDTYVGSTKQTLEKRMNGHKYPSKQARTCSSYQIVTCPTAYIELLEECDEEVRYEREKWWIENTPNCVNQNLPVRDYPTEMRKWRDQQRQDPVRYEEQKQYNRERAREWRLANPGVQAEKARERRTENREEYNQAAREWKAKNRERINARRRELYAKQKESTTEV